MRYTCSGSVRGDCGIEHKTLLMAVLHVRRDHKACASKGGGAYSDRSPERVVAGRVDALTDEEEAKVVELNENLDQAEEEARLDRYQRAGKT